MSTAAPPQDFDALLWHTGEQLRAGDPGGAAVTIERALELRPSDAKARSLFGLILFKIGRQEEARALYRELAVELPHDAGIHLNLGLVELKMGAVEAAVAALEEAIRLDPLSERAQKYLEVARRVGAQPGRLSEEIVTDPGLGEARSPSPGPPLSLPLETPQSVTAFAATRLVRPQKDGQTFAISPGGALSIRVRGELYMRTSGVVSSAGALSFEAAQRRVRGLMTTEPFGSGELAMYLARGHGELIAVPRGLRFHALALDDDVLYVREEALFAFEPALGWENGRAPGGDPALVQFRGTGQVALRTRREPFCVKIEPEQVLFADAAALVGWIGRVVPRALPTEPDVPRFLECTGEGVLIYDDFAGM